MSRPWSRADDASISSVVAGRFVATAGGGRLLVEEGGLVVGWSRSGGLLPALSRSDGRWILCRYCWERKACVVADRFGVAARGGGLMLGTLGGRQLLVFLHRLLLGCCCWWMVWVGAGGLVVGIGGGRLLMVKDGGRRSLEGNCWFDVGDSVLAEDDSSWVVDSVDSSLMGSLWISFAGVYASCCIAAWFSTSLEARYRYDRGAAICCDFNGVN